MSQAAAPIALDAMGGDFAPDEIVLGAVQARRTSGISPVLVGDREAVSAALRRAGDDGDDWRIEHAPGVVAMDEHAVTAVRTKTDSSIRRCADLLKAGEVDAFLSMGNTGAAMAAAVLVVGRAAGVERPGLAALLPSTGSPALAIDVGANADSRPRHLLAFALMGQVYQQRVLGRAAPTVGVLSIGEEDAKGNSLVFETSELLAASNLKFEGHVEPRGIVAGKVDVVVCDGFTGNILIKAMEATAEYAFAELRTHVKARRLSQLGALLMRPSFRELRRRTDYAQWGGVPLLGVNGVVILGHGRSHAEAVVSGLRVAERAVRAELVPTIAEGLSGLSASA